MTAGAEHLQLVAPDVANALYAGDHECWPEQRYWIRHQVADRLRAGERRPFISAAQRDAWADALPDLASMVHDMPVFEGTFPQPVQIPTWAAPLLRPGRYTAIDGGRGSAKTTTVVTLLLHRMRREQIRIAAARAIEGSIKESVRQAFEARIHTLGWQDEFHVGAFEINCRATGSHAFFPGVSKKVESFLSMEGLDLIWIEQAEFLTTEMETIEPTIRKPGSQLWFTWNAGLRSRASWCWQRFRVSPRPADLIIGPVNYDQNPWWSPEQEDGRAWLQENEPGRYQHIYLGNPDDGNADEQVLPYALGRKCVEAWDAGLAPDQHVTPIDVGLDLAEGGANQCAAVLRTGPIVQSVQRWPGESGSLTGAAQRAHRIATEGNAWRLYYDASAPMRGEFVRLQPTYGIRPINFGGAVGGPDVRYEPGRANGDVFRARNAQMGDALRLRARRTVRLLNGESVDPNTCLFIRSDIPRLDDYLTELSQPVRRTSPITGRWEIDKRNNAVSPDRYDATALAFCRDSDHGLRAR